MMSILLLTLWSVLHCHPGFGFRVSLLPVAKVVGSAVQKGFVASVLVSEQVSVLLTFRPKSRENAAVVKGLLPPTADVVLPSALNRLFQSSVCVPQSGTEPHAVLVSPSSWNVRSCTACAPPMKTKPTLS